MPVQFSLPGLKELLELLDRWPAWKQITGLPARVELLEKQAADLAAELAALRAGLDCPPPECCGYCGKRAMRLYYSTGATGDGVIHEDWKCGECGKIDRRAHKI